MQKVQRVQGVLRRLVLEGASGQDESHQQTRTRREWPNLYCDMRLTIVWPSGRGVLAVVVLVAIRLVPLVDIRGRGLSGG